MHTKLTLLLILTAALTAFSQSAKITATNSDWSVIEGSLSEDYPVNGNWNLTKYKGPFIVPEFKSSAPQLKNFEIQSNAFPNMLDIAIGPPAEGIYRTDQKELTRFVEFINEKAFETDNNLEYLLAFEGQWGLDEKFTTDEYLFQISSGTDNWIDIIGGNKLLTNGRGVVVLSGSTFPKKGQGIIKTSSIDANNKGLIDVKVFKKYEEFVADPYHKALKEKWYEPAKSGSLKWLAPTDNNIRKSPWLPENTPALYKRTYICKNADAAKHIYISALDSITHVWINGKQLDINSGIVPDGYLKEGENELIYYSSSILRGLSLNLQLYALRPYWIKTKVRASQNSVLSGLIRGVNARIFINGQYAGVLNKEKTDEFLGYGLFKEGENEIAVCVLQNNPKVFIEYLQIDSADESKALILPWSSNNKSLSSRAPGILSSYGSYYLQWQGGNGDFEATFNGKSAKDLELIFDSGKRFPSWMFKKDLTIPMQITFNGKTLSRTGNSFVIPADLTAEKNVIKFRHLFGGLPEPFLYLSAEAKPNGFFKFKQISRYGKERLKPGVYFTGEKVVYRVEADFSTFESVTAKIDDQSILVQKDSSGEITFEFKKAGVQKLVFEVTAGGKSVNIPGGSFYVVDFPADTEKWLQKNRPVSEILISSDAFYNSETTLFPEFHQKEWMLREIKTDSHSLEFGPLAGWKNKEKFSIFDSFPNGVPVFEKFGRRMETYMKLRSRGYPVVYTYEKKLNEDQQWNSAATVFQYLKWLESKKVKVDWQLETLAEYRQKYVDGMKKESAEFLKFRVNQVSAVIKKLALNAAPGSIFKEVEK